MRPLRPIASLGLLLLALAAPAAAQVTVRFVQPERYADIGGYRDGERNLRTLEQHLAALGKRCLAEGETLELDILDVDLAGRDEWWHRGAFDVRVMRDITWPVIELRYVWRDAAQRVLADGRERVSDMNYLWRSAWLRNQTEPLPYERAMLDDWFGQHFCPARANALSAPGKRPGSG